MTFGWIKPQTAFADPTRRKALKRKPVHIPGMGETARPSKYPDEFVIGVLLAYWHGECMNAICERTGVEYNTLCNWTRSTCRRQCHIEAERRWRLAHGRAAPQYRDLDYRPRKGSHE